MKAVAQAWTPHLISFDVKSLVVEVSLGGELGPRKGRAHIVPFVKSDESLGINVRWRRSVVPQTH